MQIIKVPSDKVNPVAEVLCRSEIKPRRKASFVSLVVHDFVP